MLFGTKPKRGLFGDALPDYSVPSQRAESAPPSVSMQPPKPEREAGTGIGAAIIGAIGDALLQRNGGQPLYAMQMMQRRQQAMQAQQQQAERQAKWEDWQRQYDYERNNPKPTRNDTIDDFNWYKSLSEPDRMIYDQQHPVVVQGPDGPYVVPRSAIRGSAPLGGSQVLGSTLPQGWTVQGGASAQPAGRPFRY